MDDKDDFEDSIVDESGNLRFRRTTSSILATLKKLITHLGEEQVCH